MAPGAGAPYNCVWQHDPTTGRLTHRTFGWLSAFSSPLAGVDYSYDRPGRLTKMDKGLIFRYFGDRLINSRAGASNSGTGHAVLSISP